MGRLSPIEVTTRYATSVESLSDAWAFVMDHVDRVGPDPRITISPMWVISADDPDGTSARQFEVCVDGMVPDPERKAVG